METFIPTQKKLTQEKLYRKISFHEVVDGFKKWL
jgi:hypothetical protein